MKSKVFDLEITLRSISRSCSRSKVTKVNVENPMCPRLIMMEIYTFLSKSVKVLGGTPIGHNFVKPFSCSLKILLDNYLLLVLMNIHTKFH